VSASLRRGGRIVAYTRAIRAGRIVFGPRELRSGSYAIRLSAAGARQTVILIVA
jgi:hypothetical protein